MKKVFWLIWKIWFYFLVLIVLLLLSPFLFITLLSEKTYPQFFIFARIWATIIFYGTGFRLRQLQKIPFEPHKSYMVVANHTSMMDIMVMLMCVKNPFVFVGKKELVKIPIFGFFYKRACIMVDRSSAVSRQQTMIRAAEKLSKGNSICIFPEGGVPDDTQIILDEFKDGAFRLAIDFQIPIAAFTIVGLKEAFPFKFFAGYPATINVFQHPFIDTKGMTQEDKQNLKTQTREMILSELIDRDKAVLK